MGVDEPPGHPIGGVDYPRTLREFDDWYPTEASCVEYLRRLRWPAGFRCPACGGEKGWSTKRGLFVCAACQRQTSVLAGTVFEGTRKPLQTWFQAMWYVTSQKQGGSALGLQRVLGLGSYQTAWAWLHKLRRAMVRPGRERLHGTVEVDETYVGGNEAGVHGRQTEDKSIVVVAAEEAGRAIGRIRLRRVPDASSASLLPFVREVVEPGSTVRTDGWSGYGDVGTNGYKHRVRKVSRGRRPAHELMPRVHRVASLLKRWLLGTHQGAVSQEHLDYYLDEFTFRFNRRTARSQGLLFYRLLQQATHAGRVPYRGLVGGAASGSEHNP